MVRQIVDRLGVGIYGVLSIIVMADLGKGTGRFNLLQRTTYAAVGLGVALSSMLGGLVVSALGYTAGFLTLAAVGVGASLFFLSFVEETVELRDARDRASGGERAAAHELGTLDDRPVERSSP